DCVEEYRMIAPLEDWAKRAANSSHRTSAEIPSIVRLPAAGAGDLEDGKQPEEKADVVRPFTRTRDNTGLRVIPYAMAASFLVLCFLLGLWAMSLRRDNQRLSQQAEGERIE